MHLNHTKTIFLASIEFFFTLDKPRSALDAYLWLGPPSSTLDFL